MPKTRFAAGCSFRLGWKLCLILTSICAFSIAQKPPAQAVIPVKDPGAIMRLAAKVNGIASDEVGPWRLKSTFTFFDAMGYATDRGTFEETWSSGREHKTTYTRSGTTWKILFTRNGIWYSGAHGPLPEQLAEIRYGFVRPRIQPKDTAGLALRKETTGSGGHALTCITADHPDAPALDRAMHKTTYCFDPESHILRATLEPFGIQVLHNDIIEFHGRFIPRNLEIKSHDRLYLKAHLESLEPAPSIHSAEFTVPPDAFAPSEHLITAMSEADAKRRQIRTAKPEYPPSALASNVSGSVDVLTRIDTAGHVYEAIAIGGPLQLQDAATDAVKKYTFEPDKLAGKPSAVWTVFKVDFLLPKLQ